MAEEKTIARNFHLPVEQAEWLRDHAFHSRESQVQIVRRALEQYRASLESPGGDGAASRRLALVQRMAQGSGVDLDVLREADRRIWGLE